MARRGGAAGAEAIALHFALTVASMAGAPLVAVAARSVLPLRMAALVVGIALGWLFVLGRFVAQAPGFARRAAQARGGSVLLAACVTLSLGGGGAFAWHARDMRTCRGEAARLLGEHAPSAAWHGEVLEGVRTCEIAGLGDDAARLREAGSRSASSSASASASGAPLRPPSASGARASVPPASPPDAGAPRLALLLAELARDPSGARPKSVTRATPGEVDYHFDVPPFRDVLLTVYGGAAARWRLDLEATRDVSGELGPVAKLCERGVASWYAIEAGPLADTFVSVGRPDFAGITPVTVKSRAELLVEKARKEEGRAFRAASLRDHVCED